MPFFKSTENLLNSSKDFSSGMLISKRSSREKKGNRIDILTRVETLSVSMPNVNFGMRRNSSLIAAPTPVPTPSHQASACKQKMYFFLLQIRPSSSFLGRTKNQDYRPFVKSLQPLSLRQILAICSLNLQKSSS